MPCLGMMVHQSPPASFSGSNLTVIAGDATTRVRGSPAHKLSNTGGRSPDHRPQSSVKDARAPAGKWSAGEGNPGLAVDTSWRSACKLPCLVTCSGRVASTGSDLLWRPYIETAMRPRLVVQPRADRRRSHPAARTIGGARNPPSTPPSRPAPLGQLGSRVPAPGSPPGRFQVPDVGAPSVASRPSS